MKIALKTEELAETALGIAALALQPFHISWWIWPFLFLSPDISMIGYAFGNRTGALTYNIVHHKGIAITLFAVGYLMASPVAMFIGTLLFAHSSFDRLLGYGLKYPDGFKHTHLGIAGN